MGYISTSTTPPVGYRYHRNAGAMLDVPCVGREKKMTRCYQTVLWHRSLILHHVSGGRTGGLEEGEPPCFLAESQTGRAAVNQLDRTRPS